MGKPFHWRVRYYLAAALAHGICWPKLKLARRRHDGLCDRCSEPFEMYAMDRLHFDIDVSDPDATSKWEKLRAMLDAEYQRFCLECSVVVENEERGEDDA